MTIPIKIPLTTAYRLLNRGGRRVEMHRLEALEENGLIRLARIRETFMRGRREYADFRNTIDVTRAEWHGVLPIVTAGNRTYVMRKMREGGGAAAAAASPPGSPPGSPARSRSTSPLPAARRRGRKYKPGELRMLARLGVMPEQERRGADRSTLSITPKGDECDDQDVNLPKPSCRLVRKVCKRYNAARQYMPYLPDGSEDKDYDISITYED